MKGKIIVGVVAVLLLMAWTLTGILGRAFSQCKNLDIKICRTCSTKILYGADAHLVG